MPKTFANHDSFVKLWVHEMSRVFRDRLGYDFRYYSNSGLPCGKYFLHELEFDIGE